MTNKEAMRRLNRIMTSINVALNAKEKAMQHPGTTTSYVASERLEKHINRINEEYEALRGALEG